jgi:hypothetical protein
MAGILDAYQFDPSTFSGAQQPPGWLGLLLGGGVPFGARSRTDAPLQPFPSNDLPQNSAPTQGTMPPAPPPAVPSGGLGSMLAGLFGPSQANAQPLQQQVPQAQEPGFGDRLGAGLANFGAGHGLLGGLSGLVSGLSSGVRTDPAGMMLQQQASTYRALVGAGVPPAVAQAAALNPEVMKTVAPQLYQKPQLVDEGQDPLTGRKFHSIYNPNTQQLTEVTPQGAQGAQGMPATTQQVFDQIEQARNAGAPQQQLLQAVPNSLRDGVSALLRGGAIPSNLSMRGQARDLAIRFAHAIDPTFDETLIPQRVAFAHGMAQTTPNSFGGQKLLLNTAIQHAGEIADRYLDLHNSNGVLTGVPGSGMVANAYNAIKNSSSDKGDTTNAINDIAQKLSGEVGKLYSGASGGGEAERQATAGRFSTSNTPQQTIGALEATKSLILDKLNSLQNNRDQVYGAQGENIYPLVDKQTQAALQKIDGAIAKLRSGGEAQQQSGAPPKITNQADWAKLPKGTQYVAPDGSVRTKR